jgi:uncharacterized protein (TIGR02145 family)
MNRIFLSLFFLSLFGCKDDSPPVVITYPIKDITSLSVTAVGYLVDDGGLPITSRGFAWGMVGQPAPEQYFEVPVEADAKGEFYATISGLTPNKNYFLRAFAENEKGTVFGNRHSFTTLNEGISLTTLGVVDITNNSAVSGGLITGDYGAEIVSRGVLWKTPQYQVTLTLENCLGFTEDGSGSGQFSSNLSGLQSNTNYQIRAYAKNSFGVFYGSIINFRTLPIPDGIVGTISDIEGNVYSTITIASKEWMAENLRTTKFRDGTEITLVTNNSQWHSTSSPAFSWFENSRETYGNAYGALYNGYAVLDNRGLCPEGWRVRPSDDWFSLINYFYTVLNIQNNYLSNDATGNRLKSCRQVNSTLGGNCNTSQHPRWNQNPHSFFSRDDFGFSALPGGQRTSFENPGEFKDIGKLVCFWTSTPAIGDRINYKVLNEYTSILDYSGVKNNGFSVRCVRDI